MTPVLKFAEHPDDLIHPTNCHYVLEGQVHQRSLHLLTVEPFEVVVTYILVAVTPDFLHQLVHNCLKEAKPYCLGVTVAM